MKRIFTLLCAAMLVGQAWAQTTFTKNDLKYTVTDETNHYVSVGKAGTKPTGDLEIKDTVSYEGVTYTVTSIPNSGFYGCNKLTSITIPNTITSIGSESFYNCNQLTEFTIPSAVTSIGKYAFRACYGLTSMDIPSGVSSIGDYAFESCSGLTAVNVESDNATYCSIDGVLFKKKNTYLSLIYYPSSKADTEYDLPDNVSSIATKAFYGCKFLASINVSNSNKDFYSDNGVLLDINKQKLIVYPSQKADTAYSIPNTVEIILHKAFYQCQNLKSLIIPTSVTDIDDYSIHNCTNLTINCCAASKPEEWLENWSYNVANVVWGYTPEETPSTKTWTVTLSANNSAYGYVSGGGTYDDGSTVTITATPKTGYKFVKWSNGLTTATATIKVTSDTTLVANFDEKAALVAGELAYEITSDSTAQVVKSDDYKTMTEVVIRETVEIDGKTYTVTSIGEDAFMYCSKITNVSIPNTVVKIGSDAFFNCDSLISMDIPNSVTHIGHGVFYGCDNLTSVSIPYSVISIDNQTFGNCQKLIEINVASGNSQYSSVDGVMFNKDKTELMYFPAGKTGEYSIPNTVTTIADEAFGYCYGLESVNIPNSVKIIKGNAFISTSLTTVTIPDGVKIIEHGAFGNCYLLKSATISNTVTELSPMSFYGCYRLSRIDVASGNSNYTSDAGIVFNKDKTEIISFPAGKTDTSYTIPSSVTKIGDYAFYGCDYLKSITIPESVTSIGSYTFDDCSNLTSITIPNSVTSIGDYAFDDCYNLASIILPKSITHINRNVFAWCNKLVYNEYDSALYLGTTDNPYFALIKAQSTGITSCQIHDSCKVIAEGAFGDCENLQYNEYDSVLYLGSTENPYLMLVKAKSTDITSCKVGNGCRFIENSAFYKCNKLTSITIPNGVQSIGEFAFYGCEKLAIITIPESVRSIGNYAFFNCESLTAIAIPDGVTFIDNNTFCNCRNLASVTIPNSITSISYWAFANCPITKINIPESVESIDQGAFIYCNKLNQIMIPNSVTTIGERAFSECNNLTIFCEAEAKPVGWNDDWNSSGRPVVWGFDPSMKIFNVALSANSEWRGIVTGGGLAVEGSTVTITATPKLGYHFVKWSNGQTTDTATITVTSDTTLVAEFAEDKTWSVTLLANNTEYGTVTKISGTHLDGSIFTAAASPFPGYKFVKWSNGLTTDTISITLTSDTTLTAEFAEIVYEGTCGDDARWRFSMQSKTLTISGTGSIDNYKSVSVFSTEVNRPWQEIADQIEKVVIGEGITNLGSRAFCYLNNLKEAIISSTCDSYGGMSFAYCPNLKKMVVAANSVYQANEYCFSNYDSCTLYVPAGKVDYYKKDIIFGMFSKIVGAYIVTIDGNMKNGTVEVDNYTVTEGGTLKITPKPDNGYKVNIVYANGKAAEKYGSVYYVYDVTANVIVSAEFYKEGATESGFTYKVISGTNIEITKYNGTDSVITIPSTITDNGVEYTVTSIGDRAFYDNNDVKSITIPNTVTSIGASTFAYTNLISLTIPNSVKTIGNDAFGFVKNVIYDGNAEGSPWGALTVNGIVDGNYVFADAEKTHLTAYICRGENETIDLPESVVTIGTWAFINGSFKYTIYNNAVYWGNDENPYLILDHIDDANITSCKIHSDCKYILYFAFANSNLESETIPQSVISIGEGAFWGCEKLKSVIISNGVETIGNDAFGNCEQLSSVSIAGSVKTIGDRAFTDCPNLSSLTISDGVEKIGEGAFCNCHHLESLNIPKSVTEIGERAFDDCYLLTIYSDATEWPAGWLFSASEVSDVIFKNNTAVSETAANAVNIYAHHNTIVVENATDEILVYDAMGNLVCRNAINRVRTEIPINGTGVYIVKTGNVAKGVIVN